MNTRNHAALLAAAVIASGLTLASCGDVDAGDSPGGYAEGYQPGRYAPAPELSVPIDSGIRAQLAKQAENEALLLDD